MKTKFDLLAGLLAAVVCAFSVGCVCPKKTINLDATEVTVQVRHLDGTPVLGCQAGFYNTVSGKSTGLVEADSRGKIHLVFARSTQPYLIGVIGPEKEDNIQVYPQRGRWRGYPVGFTWQYPIEAGTLPPRYLVVKFSDGKTVGAAP